MLQGSKSFVVGASGVFMVQPGLVVAGIRRRVGAPYLLLRPPSFCAVRRHLVRNPACECGGVARCCANEAQTERTSNHQDYLLHLHRLLIGPRRVPARSAWRVAILRSANCPVVPWPLVRVRPLEGPRGEGGRFPSLGIEQALLSHRACHVLPLWGACKTSLVKRPELAEPSVAPAMRESFANLAHPQPPHESLQNCAERAPPPPGLARAPLVCTARLRDGRRRCRPHARRCCCGRGFVSVSLSVFADLRSVPSV